MRAAGQNSSYYQTPFYRNAHTRAIASGPIPSASEPVQQFGLNVYSALSFFYGVT